jgi:hypothetical protein
VIPSIFVDASASVSVFVLGRVAPPPNTFLNLLGTPARPLAKWNCMLGTGANMFGWRYFISNDQC